MLDFELAGRAQALQTATYVRLHADFAKTNCRRISADCGRYNPILCAAWNSSGCDFLFVDADGSCGRDLFLEIGTYSLAPDRCAVVLLSPALVQHA